MNVQHKELPRFTLEDELAILRGLVCLAWLGAIAMLGLELFIRYFEPGNWPKIGNFNSTYNLLLGEFMLNSLVLTALLVHRNWYEHTPRESVNRLGWLLTAVIIWIGLHYFAVFHVLGSIHGPLIPLLPIVCALILVLFPGKQGWLITTYFVAGHFAVLYLESQNLISNPGQLAKSAAQVTFTSNSVFLLFLTLAPAVVIGRIVRARFDETGSAIYREPRIDPNSKLFNFKFLDQRLQSELNRAQRQKFPCSLLVIELQGLDTHLNADAQSRLRQTVFEVGQSILGNIRISMDTPCNPVFSPNVIAILFPNAGLEDAKRLQERIAKSISEIPTVDNQGLWTNSGLVVINDASNVTASQVMNAAAEELVNSSGEIQVRVLPVS